ncbi:MAG: hypothetical protein O9340_16190 [Cyclobacteriaceae bacterium]|jgi:hypothetical protein|nr:hypothetical protein [Cyclobacteriaceae bacterium]
MKKIQKKKFKLKSGIIIGLIAILLNIITVSVYMYQAKIMKEQLHASSWPYVEWQLIFNEDTGIRLEVNNNGVGPALIKGVNVRLNEKSIQPDSIFIYLLGTNYFPHVTSKLDNRVLSSQNGIKLFQITNLNWAQKVKTKFDSINFELEICYESIYGEKWTTGGITVTKGSRCEN